MRKSIIVTGVAIAADVVLTAWSPAESSVLKAYDGAHMRRIALPVGGIGSGTVSLGGRGELTDWQLINVPAIGYQPAEYEFAEGQALVIRSE